MKRANQLYVFTTKAEGPADILRRPGVKDFVLNGYNPCSQSSECVFLEILAFTSKKEAIKIQKQTIKKIKDSINHWTFKYPDAKHRKDYQALLKKTEKMKLKKFNFAMAIQ